MGMAISLEWDEGGPTIGPCPLNLNYQRHYLERRASRRGHLDGSRGLPCW